MLQPDIQKCLDHPKFKQLAKTRGRLSMLFGLIVTLNYGLYVLAISFLPNFMARSWNEKSSVTYGIVFAVFVIVSGMLAAGIYTWWANRKFDVLRNELMKDLGHE